MRLPGLETPFDPILVEIAGRRASIPRKLDQLADAITKAKGRLGLLVTLDDVKTEGRHDANFTILTVSLQRLEDSPEQVVQDLRWARNSMVHGLR